jgi:uncharacterized membrane protein
MDLIARIIHAVTELHPLHPMLVHFPIGLTGGGAFFMLLALINGRKFLEQAAFANLALAAAATVAAGVTGIMDNTSVYDGDAPNATAKIILATVLLIVTAATAYLRWRNPDLFENRSTRAVYAAAYFVSFGLALVLAFLGGVILYGF